MLLSFKSLLVLNDPRDVFIDLAAFMQNLSEYLLNKIKW